MEDDKIEKRFDNIDQNLGKINKTLDKIVDKLIDHEGRLEKIEEKMPKLDLIDGIIVSQDEVLKILHRMEAEQAANIHRSNRHEERIEVLETDVKELQVAVLQ